MYLRQFFRVKISFRGSALPEEIQVSQVVLSYLAELLARKAQVQFKERKVFSVSCDDTVCLTSSRMLKGLGWTVLLFSIVWVP